MDTLKALSKDQKPRSCESLDLEKIRIKSWLQSGYKDKLLEQNRDIHDE